MSYSSSIILNTCVIVSQHVWMDYQLKLWILLHAVLNPEHMRFSGECSYETNALTLQLMKRQRSEVRGHPASRCVTTSRYMMEM